MRRSISCNEKVNDSLNALRKRIMRTYQDEKKDSEEYKLLKHRYYLILKNKDDLKNDDYEYDHILNAHVTESYIAEKILEISPYLSEAYRIKEEFISLNDETPETFKDRSEKEKELNSLIRRMMISEIPEMIECAKTLKNWKEEILNSFVWFEKEDYQMVQLKEKIIILKRSSVMQMDYRTLKEPEINSCIHKTYMRNIL